MQLFVGKPESANQISGEVSNPDPSIFRDGTPVEWWGGGSPQGVGGPDLAQGLKPESANQISGEVSNPDQACTNEDTYDGPRGQLLREYHDALERWRVEFHKTDKDLAVVDAHWAAVLPAYRAAFGKEASPEEMKRIRSSDEYEENEKVRIRNGRILNPCITTNIKDDFDNPDVIAIRAAWDALKNMPKGSGLGAPGPEKQKAVEAYDAAWSKWQARRAGCSHSLSYS